MAATRVRKDGRPIPMGKPFKPGNKVASVQRKPPVDVEAYARTFSKEMTDVLREIALNEKHPPSSRVTAACAVLDRAHGRPRQAVDMSGTVNFGVNFNAFVRQLITGESAEEAPKEIDATDIEEEDLELPLLQANGPGSDAEH